MLRRYRTERSWTQEELAERAGLSVRGIRALEQGERKRPYSHTVLLLADVLGLTAAERATFEKAARARPAAGERPQTAGWRRSAWSPLWPLRGCWIASGTCACWVSRRCSAPGGWRASTR
ncbi:MAG: helix-turn-helix transcriptional regulator [Chloroflexi bacterium]|nr:helix-turn-helix transcriptional regulator [Chloroflexota bacterium]